MRREAVALSGKINQRDALEPEDGDSDDSYEGREQDVLELKRLVCAFDIAQAKCHASESFKQLSMQQQVSFGPRHIFYALASLPHRGDRAWSCRPWSRCGAT